METRDCQICSRSFTFTRTVGRPPSICGADCRREANRLRQARWFARLKAAKAQMDALQAGAA